MRYKHVAVPMALIRSNTVSMGGKDGCSWFCPTGWTGGKQDHGQQYRDSGAAASVVENEPTAALLNRPILTRPAILGEPELTGRVVRGRRPDRRRLNVVSLSLDDLKGNLNGRVKPLW